jgi:type IV pilus assembly protein PilV
MNKHKDAAMTHHARQNEAGFSLIEVLVALTIFAVGLLATAGMQITALQSNAGAHKMTSINTAAAGIMEEILTWAPDDPRLVDENSGNPRSWDFDPTAAVNNTLTVGGGGVSLPAISLTRLFRCQMSRRLPWR